MPDPILITPARPGDPDHNKAILELLDSYSRDPMGNGAPLPGSVRGRLIEGLQQHPTSLILLAFEGTRAVGICVCFEVFSSFRAKPVLNIHDLAVNPGVRNRGIGNALLDAAEKHARARGCCKLTLEVREDNDAGQHLYRKTGFRDCRPRMYFWHKPLSG